MPDAIAQLCQLIAEKLRDAPEATLPEVMAHSDETELELQYIKGAIKSDS